MQGGSVPECHLTSTLKIMWFVRFVYCFDVWLKMKWVNYWVKYDDYWLEWKLPLLPPSTFSLLQILCKCTLSWSYICSYHLVWPVNKVALFPWLPFHNFLYYFIVTPVCCESHMRFVGFTIWPCMVLVVLLSSYGADVCFLWHMPWWLLHIWGNFCST